MDTRAFRREPEAEARILLLIDAFSQGPGTLQGRVKLAKLDFLLRYPQFFRRALEARGKPAGEEPEVEEDNIDSRMVRYRYGPWDPAYYAILGSPVGLIWQQTWRGRRRGRRQRAEPASSEPCSELRPARFS